MQSDHDTASYPASESVGSFYDQMGEFFAATLGDNLHFGLWDDDNTLSMSVAQERLTGRLIDFLQPERDEYVLDVGCGTGHPAIRLVERTRANVVGVNISPAQVAAAVARCADAGLSSRLEFIRADAMKLPYEPATFDAAWAIEMLFHVPDREQVLREMCRTLKPGGRLVLTDFVEREQLTSEEWGLLAQKFAFSSLLRYDQYAAVVSRCGLEVIGVYNVTAETSASPHWIQSRYDDNSARLAAHYGPDFATQMNQFLPVAMALLAKLGYVIVEARRPRL